MLTLRLTPRAASASEAPRIPTLVPPSRVAGRHADHELADRAAV